MSDSALDDGGCCFLVYFRLPRVLIWIAMTVSTLDTSADIIVSLGILVMMDV